MRSSPFLYLLLCACAKAGTGIDPDDAGGDGAIIDPSLLAPKLNTVNGGTCAIDVTFAWNDVPGASFTLEYGKKGVAPTSVEVPAGTTSYKVPTKLTTASWTARVRANKGGASSQWSNVVDFAVGAGKAGSFVQNPSDFTSNTNVDAVVVTDGVSLAGSVNAGSGSGGAFNATTSTSITSGTHEYTSFSIGSGATVTISGTSVTIIKVQGDVQIDGTLTVSGNVGGNGVTSSKAGSAGTGVSGGSNGGAGVYSTTGPLAGSDGSGTGKGLKGMGWTGGSGAGYGTSGGNAPGYGSQAAITGGSSYGSADLSSFLGGSGGGGGSGGYNCGSGGGGAGGGALEMVSGKTLTISASGTIVADGGKGGSDGSGNCGGGGGGSGGALWLIAPKIDNQGTISASGGGAGTSSAGVPGGSGGEGRIRLDGVDINQGAINPAPGYTAAVPFKSPGTTTTIVIEPPNLCGWGKLDLVTDVTKTGTAITVDVLDDKDAVIAPNVATGTDLSTLAPVVTLAKLKLRGNLTTSDPAGSPILKSWTLGYQTK